MTRKLNQAKLHSLLRQSPSLFFAHLFPKIEYIEDFKCPWHLHAISHQLLAMHKGRCRRLILNAPPRSLKTSLANSYFIPWLLGKNPKTNSNFEVLKKIKLCKFDILLILRFI